MLKQQLVQPILSSVRLQGTIIIILYASKCMHALEVIMKFVVASSSQQYAPMKLKLLTSEQLKLLVKQKWPIATA